MSTCSGDRHVLVAFGWHFLGVRFGFWAYGCKRVGVHGLCQGWPPYVGGLAPVLVGLAPMLGVIGSLRDTFILVISSLFLWWVCTLPRCMLPKHNPIFPDEGASAQRGSIVPYETMRWEGTTFALIYMQKLYLWPDLPHICGSRPQCEMTTVIATVTCDKMSLNCSGVSGMAITGSL